MKRYTGTKTLFAKPMSRGDYNTYRGWTVPENEDPMDEGYLVEYTDGGQANDSRHLGYISWSPQDVFERTYKEVKTGTEPANAYQQRVRDELAELDVKGKALTKFLGSVAFMKLDLEDRRLLQKQVYFMSDYADTLELRISRFQP